MSSSNVVVMSRKRMQKIMFLMSCFLRSVAVGKSQAGGIDFSGVVRDFGRSRCCILLDVLGSSAQRNNASPASAPTIYPKPRAFQEFRNATPEISMFYSCSCMLIYMLQRLYMCKRICYDETCISAFNDLPIWICISVRRKG